MNRLVVWEYPRYILSDATTCAKKTITDNKVCFSWETEILINEIHFIVPSVLLSHIMLQDIMIYCNGKKINAKFDNRGNLFICKFDKQKTKTIEICIAQHKFNELLYEYITIHSADLIFDAAKISSSSSYDRYVSANVMNNDLSFWCPLKTDPNMWIDITFPEPISISSILIEQVRESVRIVKYCIEYKCDNIWERLFIDENAECSDFLFAKFKHVIASNIRIRILDTREDIINGQKVPLIKHIYVYNV